jgi:hypothetical protein
MSFKEERERARQSVRLYADYTLRNYQRVRSLVERVWRIAELEEQLLRQACADYAYAMLEALAIDVAYLFRAYGAQGPAELADVVVGTALDPKLARASASMYASVRRMFEVAVLTHEPKWGYELREAHHAVTTYLSLLGQARSASPLFTVNKDFHAEIARLRRALAMESSLRLSVLRLFSRKHESPLYKATATLLKVRLNLLPLALALSLAYPRDHRTLLTLLRLLSPALFKTYAESVAKLSPPQHPDQGFAARYREKVEAEWPSVRHAAVDLLEAYPRALTGMLDPQVWSRVYEKTRDLLIAAYVAAHEAWRSVGNAHAYAAVRIAATGALVVVEDIASKSKKY